MAVTLTINSTSFRTPNAISRIKNRVVVSQRSLNNTLLTDLWDYGKKDTLEFKYDMLTNAEMATLETWIDAGAFTVVIADPDDYYAYSASSILTYGGYSEDYSGYKTGVTVTVQQI